MYELGKRVGRYGFEVQTHLLVDPAQLVFDPTAKKLGTEFRSAPPLPPGWRWTADPTSPTKYAGPIPEGYYLSDHHRRYHEAVGYRTYWVYRECDQVAFQLELVSEPFDDAYGARQFGEDARRIYRESLSELVGRGLVAAFDPSKRQAINEQISIELDDVRWSERVDPLRKLSWLGCGFYLLTRLRPLLSPPDEHVADLLAALDDDFVAQARTLRNHDVFRSYRLLLDGYFFGRMSTLDWEGLRRIVGSRIHAAVLSADYDNDRSYCLVHGTVDLEGEALGLLQREDFDLLRHFGIDSRFLELLFGETQTHLDPRRGDQHAMLREGIGRLFPLDMLASQLRKALEGEAVPGSVTVPLCHPRKSLTDGCVYLEWRAVRRLRVALPERYPTRFLSVDTPGGPLEVIFFDHMHRAAHDLSTLMDIAILAGEQLADAIEAGEHGIAERDFERMAKRFVPRLDYLLRTYQRPPWEGTVA